MFRAIGGGRREGHRHDVGIFGACATLPSMDTPICPYTNRPYAGLHLVFEAGSEPRQIAPEAENQLKPVDHPDTGHRCRLWHGAYYDAKTGLLYKPPESQASTTPADDSRSMAEIRDGCGKRAMLLLEQNLLREGRDLDIGDLKWFVEQMTGKAGARSIEADDDPIAGIDVQVFESVDEAG